MKTWRRSGKEKWVGKEWRERNMREERELLFLIVYKTKCNLLLCPLNEVIKT